MRCSSWLNLIRTRLSSPKRRVRTIPSSRTTEQLESRALLTVSAFMIGSELSIVSTGPDNIVVRENPTNAGKVQVLANGANVALASTNANSVSAISISGSDSNNAIDLSGVLAAVFSNASLQINVQAGDGDDLIIGSPDVANNLSGFNGADTLVGGSQADTLNGEDGNDSIRAGDGNDSLIGDDGADRINGEGGNDTVNAGDGSDIINGGDGDDSLSAGNGSDSMSGGNGNDFLNGESGNDTLRGDAGFDSILGGSEDDSLDGGDDNDTVNGQAGNDTVGGGAGSDLLLGDLGADSMQGGDGDDVVNGQAGNDTLEGGNGSDQLIGGNDQDILYDDFRIQTNSGTGNDTLLGGSGNDTLIATGGSDSLDGGIGNDLLDTRSASLSINDVQIIPEGNSGSRTVTFTVTLSSGLGVPVTVNFATSSDGTNTGGTATAGSDYLATSGTLTFAVGQTSRTVSVTVLGDTLNESDAETFFVNLSNSVNATIADGLGEGRIFDDDPAPPPPVLDIFLLLDDTGTFTNAGPTIRTAFPSIIAQLQANFPGADLAFGVGRFEDYSASANGDRPFILNQPIITDDTVGFSAAIDAALNRSSPGSGGDLPETGIEGLFQVATGAGFDGNNDGDTTDSGAAGLAATQTTPTAGGDVPAYSSFTPDAANNVLAPTVPVAGATTGVGFRAGARHIVLLPTDAGFKFEADSVNPYTGVGGVTVAASAFTPNSSNVTPQGRGARIQATIDALIADNIEVIGLGTAVGSAATPRVQLEALAILTGALNRTSTPLENGITPGASADDIQPNSPLYFLINPGDAVGLAAAIVNGVTGAVGNPPPPPPAPPPPTPPAAGTQTDTLLGNDGNDTLLAGETNDFLNGGAGSDFMDGGDGADSMLGGSSNDTLNGGGGNDTVDGQGGNDSVNGGVGDDTMVWNGVGDGIDTLTSTSGADSLIVNGTALVNTFVIGKSSSGTLQVSEGSASIVVSSLVTSVFLNAGLGNDTVTINDLSGVAPALLFVNGDGGNDTINASSATLGSIRLGINGGDGNDTVNGSLGNDTIDGGNGDDSLIANAGNDTLIGGTGNDLLNSGAGNDRAVGGDGNDIVLGGDGNDQLSGDLGNDSLDGGNQDDTLTGDLGDDTLVGGSGNDSMSGNSGFDSLSGGLGNDTCDGGVNDDIVNGNEGDDKLRGGDGNDSITGDLGNDELVGGDGNDTLIAGDGNDGVSGGDGDDILNGGAGNDTLAGGDGNDSIYGGAGNDIALGEDGDDRIDGQSGQDTISGGTGTDTILGTGDVIDETFVFTPAMLAALDGI